MTPKQTAYAQHRAAGLGQARAAIAAGYAPGSAKVVASRNERMPAIRKAIKTARAAVPKTATAPKFEDAESYLDAVVKGTVLPDPLRIQAARTLIAYQRRRQRAPMPSATPAKLNERAVFDTEREFLDDWAKKAATVRAKLAN